jgi:Glycosyl transferases group 1
VKILVVAVHFEVTGARYITDAFKRLGHDVRHVGQLTRLRDAWGVDVADKYIWWPNAVVDYSDYDTEWIPDLVIIADTIVTTDYTQNLLRIPKHIPVIKWVQDNHVRNVREDGITHYFLAHKHGQAQPVTHADETWLPCAADTSVFTPSPIAWEDRAYDVAMIGVMYPHRLEVIEALKAAGLKVYASTGDVYDEYRAIYQNSRISLCLSANDDLAQRVFETGAMGCLVAMNVPADVRDEKTALELGINGYLQISNTQEAVNLIKLMLTVDKSAAKTAAANWQRTVLERHDWTHRAQVVIDWYEENYGETQRELEDRRDTFYTDNLPKGQAVTSKAFPERIYIGGEVNDNNQATGRKMFTEGGKTYIEEADGSFYEKTFLKPSKPYLNLGCGKTHLPSAVPAGHQIVAQTTKGLYDYPLWVNVDKIDGVGADKVFDIFQFPWPLADNSYDGALCAHILEHIPHEIKTPDKVDIRLTATNEVILDASRARYLSTVQDGWYAFFSELYRVLTPGAIVHCLAPYGHSHGAITDPTHTRYLTADTFTHSMQPSADGSTFQYNNGGINFEVVDMPVYELNDIFYLMKNRTGFDMDVLLMAYNNTCFNFYVKLKVVK